MVRAAGIADGAGRRCKRMPVSLTQIQLPLQLVVVHCRLSLRES